MYYDIIHEVSATKMNAKTLKIELLDIELLVKKNELKQITNPVFFERNNVPTQDGLLSNEIFGIVKADRANIFAYIDLVNYYMHPLVYKIWSKMDSHIIEIVHGTKKFRIDSKGHFVEDENGSTGIKFLKDNINKIKIESTGSVRRDRNIKFINENRDKMFMKKWIVIPAFYRDINTNDGYVGVGDINKLYSSLLMGLKSVRESKDYGFDVSEMMNGRIQETLLNIYDWFAKEPNIYGKKGIVKRSVMTKTSDYGARVVISAPNLRAERPDELQVDLDHTAVPLASACVTFFPYIVFYLRRFFENEFVGRSTYPIRDGEDVEIDDPMTYFTDEKIKREVNRFIKGFSNRFVPIEVPVKEGQIPKGKNVYMKFEGRMYKGKFTDKDNIDENQMEILKRKLTWCDLFYRAAVEVSKDKHVMITRFPIDSYFNIFPTKVTVSSTKETEPMIINNEIYKFYPKIREEDIGSNTSNKFVDTLQMSNLHLKSIGGDYDGDQVSIRGVFTVEANEDCAKYTQSKGYYLGLDGQNIRTMGTETVQAMYVLTKTNSKEKYTDPIF